MSSKSLSIRLFPYEYYDLIILSTIHGFLERVLESKLFAFEEFEGVLLLVDTLNLSVDVNVSFVSFYL